MSTRHEETLHQRNILMTNKHIRRFSVFLIMREIQTKTMMKHHYTGIRNKTILTTPNAGKDV